MDGRSWILRYFILAEILCVGVHLVQMVPRDDLLVSSRWLDLLFVGASVLSLTPRRRSLAFAVVLLLPYLLGLPKLLDLEVENSRCLLDVLLITLEPLRALWT